MDSATDYNSEKRLKIFGGINSDAGIESTAFVARTGILSPAVSAEVTEWDCCKTKIF
jgi:hypothetical protein